MKVSDIIRVLEAVAPPIYQESYDNSGLQVGERSMEVSGVLVALDITEAILEEALQRNCNMIVAHHPLLFSGIKSLSGRNYVERIVMKAIKNDIALYAIHTNLDNMRQGVNAKIGERLGLKNLRVLTPAKDTLYKLSVFVPTHQVSTVRDALFQGGAGQVGAYSECSFTMAGAGTFKPGANTQPAIGTAGGNREYVAEEKLEVLVPKDVLLTVVAAMKKAHPYEEVAYDVVALELANPEIGAGMVGQLEQPMPPEDFLAFLKERMHTSCIRHTALLEQPIQTVAYCGGAGSFLLPAAKAAGADIFITGDYKYHQFFDADGQLVIADIGHYESEQFTSELIVDILNKNFPNFATLLTNLSTNPIKYYY